MISNIVSPSPFVLLLLGLGIKLIGKSNNDQSRVHMDWIAFLPRLADCHMCIHNKILMAVCMASISVVTTWVLAG